MRDHRQECYSLIEGIFGDGPTTEGDLIVINYFALVFYTEIVIPNSKHVGKDFALDFHFPDRKLQHFFPLEITLIGIISGTYGISKMLCMCVFYMLIYAN